MKKGVLVAIAGFAVGAVVLVAGYLLMMAMTIFGAGGAAACAPGAPAPVVSAAAPANGSLPESIAGYSGEQLTNAQAIIAAARAMNLGGNAQVIGVMTAMDESSLRNIDYGDWETSGWTNPDGSRTTSIGLFQQQDGWGSRADRLNPQKAATMFFQALIQVPGWDTLPPIIAAHRTQINADANDYQPYLEPATQVVSALTGLPLSSQPGSGTCKIGPGGNNYPAAAGTEPGPWGGFSNGGIPSSALQPIPWAPEHALRPDATAALVAMDQKFLADNGFHLPINDGYRDFDQQVRDKATYGDGAATPGTSNHGWGLAIDVGTQQHYTISESDATYAWLKQNAAAFGWKHPDWAEPGGPGPQEAWHWEYWGKEKSA